MRLFVVLYSLTDGYRYCDGMLMLAGAYQPIIRLAVGCQRVASPAGK